MYILEPKHEIIKNDSDPLIAIERAGRLCYKSEAAVTPDSAKKFVARLAERGHYAMLEHATIYLAMGSDTFHRFTKAICGDDRFLCLTEGDGVRDGLVSGNVRAWIEVLKRHTSQFIIELIQCHLAENMPILFEKDAVPRKALEEYATIDVTANSALKKYKVRILTEDEMLAEYAGDSDTLRKHHRISIKFTCDRGVTHEFVRHRDASFAQESTRYCNYSKGQFGNQISVIRPAFWDESKNKEELMDLWVKSCEAAERQYFALLDSGATPQEARSVLPNSLKAELLITANEEEWQHICDLRATTAYGVPHPQMLQVMAPTYEELKEITNGRIH